MLTLFQPPARMMVDVLCPHLRSSCAAPTLGEPVSEPPVCRRQQADGIRLDIYLPRHQRRRDYGPRRRHVAVFEFVLRAGRDEF